MIEAAGFVLAGGRSTRMGRDKALLEVGGEPLVALALQGLGRVCATVAIAGGAPGLAHYGRLIVDEHPGCGPLAGIVAALEQTTHAWNLFVPVDVPIVPTQVWHGLLARAMEADCACVMARGAGQVQPLIVAFARSAAAALREELDAGRLKVTAAAARAGAVAYVDFAESTWFSNVNTPQEFAVLQSPAGARDLKR